MVDDTNSEKNTDRKPDDAANTMDRPLPGSDGAVPNTTASGVAEPIEATERASGIDPGHPTPTQASEHQESPKQRPEPEART